MQCAVYFRLARDEDRAYKEAVYNEQLRSFGYRIPMRVPPIVTAALQYADKSVDPQRRETPQQAAERIRRALSMSDLLKDRREPFGHLFLRKRWCCKRKIKLRC